MDLVRVIKEAVPKGARQDGPHPAKRTFQALRIEVNQELGILEGAIRDMAERLTPGGRICILTFHSLEDRIVKNFLKAGNAEGKLEKDLVFGHVHHNFELVNRKVIVPCTCPKEFPVCVCGKKPVVRVITRKPILPGAEEVEDNPRSRSAKLRIAERV